MPKFMKEDLNQFKVKCNKGLKGILQQYISLCKTLMLIQILGITFRKFNHNHKVKDLKPLNLNMEALMKA